MAKISIDKSIKTYVEDSKKRDAILSYHPVEEISAIEAKMYQIDPLVRVAVEQLISEARKELLSLRKPDVVIYSRLGEKGPSSKWISKRILSMYEGIVGKEKVFIVEELDDLRRLSLPLP